MRRFQKHFTYANVMASLAIVMSLGGTAYAAATLTGANIKDGTLTGIDVKNGTLAAADLSGAAKIGLKGATGARGLTGSKGLQGVKGDTGTKGDTGVPGDPAQVVTSFASRDMGLLTKNNFSPPNPNSTAWYNYNCDAAGNTTAGCANDEGNQRNQGVGVIDLIGSETMVLALQGMSKDPSETNHVISSRNSIIVPWANNMTGMASITLLKEGVAGTATTVHGRAECSLEYANSATPSVFAKLGEPQMVSSFGTKEVITMTLVGSKNIAAGTYNVRAVCRDMDDTSNADYAWHFVSGNLTAMAAKNS